jgi:tetratricopeptide (TPR) repeat protein
VGLDRRVLDFISSWQGDPVAAERELRPAYDALKKIGEKSHFSSMCHALSNAVYLQGRYEEAEQLTRECEEASRANDVYSQIHWRSTRAKALARMGQLEPAERLAREAVEYAATSDFYLGHADALMDLAEVLTLAGNSDATAAPVREAIRFYELKGNLLAADLARRQLVNGAPKPSR